MKKLILFSIIFICAAISLFYLPWWFIMVIAFLLFFFKTLTPGQSFWIAGSATGLVWLLLSFYKDYQNDFILSERLSSLFYMPKGWMLQLLSGIIGFITAGIGAYMGNSIRLGLKNTKRTDVSGNHTA